MEVIQYKKAAFIKLKSCPIESIRQGPKFLQVKCEKYAKVDFEKKLAKT